MARILICDDEAGLRVVIKRYDVFEVHDVIEAGDGMEAVRLCRNNTLCSIFHSLRLEH